MEREPRLDEVQSIIFLVFQMNYAIKKIVVGGNLIQV